MTGEENIGHSISFIFCVTTKQKGVEVYEQITSSTKISTQI